MKDRENSPADKERRVFLKASCTVAIGGVLAAVPGAAGLVVALDPLGRKAQSGEPIRITTLEALPTDGTPLRFAIVAERSDAWNKYPEIPIGAIYLRRTGDGAVQALNVVCPHAGCFIDYLAGQNTFFCPCHNSRFGLDGGIADEKSPSPRGMDSLEVEIREGREVWVKFQNFRTGRPEKTPVT
jgi:menaquinol-cytochrome c reductase iron-sulfur subunit